MAALVLAAAPFAARDAAAQRPNAIGAVVMVAPPHLAIALHSEVAAAALPADVQHVRVAGFGVLDVRSAASAAIRVAPREAGRPAQDSAARPDSAAALLAPSADVIRVTIDYIGS